MTRQETVEGGLDEPAELEPDQGSLDLVAPEDRHDRAEWEAAAAAVLRKARRLGDDDPDEQVWRKLTRTTLDGIAITPLGTPDLLEGLATSGRPARAGGWDVRAHVAVSDGAPGNELLLAELIHRKCQEGIAVFDLGVGEARYKTSFCDDHDDLVDSFLPLTLKGRFFARAAQARRALKRRIKRSPTALKLAHRVSGWLRRREPVDD